MAIFDEANLVAERRKAAKYRTNHVGTKLNEAELREFEALAGGPAFRVLCEGRGCSLITENIRKSIVISLHALGIEALSTDP